jgi:hypothetical protein
MRRSLLLYLQVLIGYTSAAAPRITDDVAPELTFGIPGQAQSALALLGRRLLAR